MSGLRLAVIGAGRMGTALQSVAEAAGDTVVATINRDVRIDTESLRGAQVAIDFTVPDAAVNNVKRCIDADCPVVVGTTGWYDKLDDVTAYAAAHAGSVLWAANFSLGVYALGRLMHSAGLLFAAIPGFDVRLVETHHVAKKDAPSGTALALQRETESGLGRHVPITSIRLGAVPGTHELRLDGAYEQIVISHEARDRRLFAEGALVAARWLPGRHGVFTLADVLDSGNTPS